MGAEFTTLDVDYFNEVLPRRTEKQRRRIRVFQSSTLGPREVLIQLSDRGIVIF